MIRNGLFAAAFAFFLTASGFAQTTVTLSFQAAGKTRSSVVRVPAGIDKPAVVFFVHGANGSGAGFQNETRGNTTADREKFIAVYPSASSNGNAGVWEDMYGTGNFPFFLALIDTLDARYKIDRNRIYMTGFSQGGMISFAAGCFYSDIFAAVAPVSGHSNATACNLKRPVPMYMTFGANEGASGFVTDLNRWTKLDSCPAAPTVTRPYPASKPDSKVTRISYGPCAQGTSVVMDSIQGQGHQWPSQTTQMQADEAWNFFKKYSLATPTGISEGRLSPHRERISISYAAGMVRLGGAAEQSRVRVTDTRGRLVAAGKANQGVFPFHGKTGGVYVATVDGGEGAVARKFVLP